MRRVFLDSRRLIFGSLLVMSLILATSLVATSFAVGDPATNQTPVYQIQQMDPSVPAQKLAGPRVQVHPYSDDQRGWKLPSVADREKAFYRAGLRPDIESWDQLDRDMLYLRARDLSVVELSSQYPQISRSKLKALHHLLSRKNARKAGK